jgi:DNA-binding response OmpR family regulator
MPPDKEMGAALPELPATLDSKSVLVLSAEPVIRDLVARFLEIDGYIACTASDVAQAVARARERQFALIVLDSDLRGAKTVRARFKTESTAANLPVLWVGPKYAKVDFAPFVAAPSDDVLPMPFTRQQIIQKVHRLIGSSG